NSSHLMGTFTINLDVAEQHIRAGIPVYLVRPIDQFSNQVILKAEKPVVFPLNTSLPSPPFPVIFKGDPSHPQKFHAMHRFMQIFNTYRNPFNFITVSQSPVVHTQAAASGSSSTSATSCHPMHNQRGKGRVLGPLASAQASRKKKNSKISIPNNSHILIISHLFRNRQSTMRQVYEPCWNTCSSCNTCMGGCNCQL
ncbi:hypothetical protein EDD18DRAFT_1085524, partial [Armillaria luteobubalina]